MANLVSRDFSDVKPGDVMFYTGKGIENLVYSGAQYLSPSTTALGAKYTHAAVVLEADKDKVTLAHSYATAQGPHISVRTLEDLARYKRAAVLSPGDTENIPTSETFAKVATYSASKFIKNDSDEEVCPSQTCSRYRLLVRPLTDPKILKEEERQKKIAKGLVDFMMENPRLEKIDSDGNPVRKASFCAEFVHSAYQTAAYYDRLNDQNREMLKALCDMKEKQFDRLVRNSTIDFIADNFHEFFPNEGQNNDLSMQNSTSLAPGRLFTELQKKGYQVREIRPVQ
ncbi:MAG: hypothetical protein JSS32_05515 [Verrucomicrobia bacterium]|nr:hypothetical protein [Verrucomicrobiota bacterium]